MPIKKAKAVRQLTGGFPKKIQLKFITRPGSQKQFVKILYRARGLFNLGYKCNGF